MFAPEEKHVVAAIARQTLEVFSVALPRFAEFDQSRLK